jgi:hypothetical protein
MDTSPEFLTKRETIQAEITFQPASTSRKGELIAWGSAVVTGLVLAIVYVSTREIQFLTGAMFVFFLATSLLITFGMWVDSRTSAKVSPDHLHFQSPFRNVKLEWDQVEEVRAVKAGTVWRVVVVGASRYFRIRVLEKREGSDASRQILSFPQADRFVRIICGMAKLKHPIQHEGEWFCQRL